MPPQYIFTIENLSKAYGKKEVLKNIWLSFYPGAKIGVIGGNGSGKSTLLRIMAGLETRLHRHGPAGAGDLDRLCAPGADARPSPRRSRQCRDRPWPRSRHHLDRFDEINARLGEGPDADEMDDLLEEQAKVQDAIEAAEGWDLDRRDRDRHGRHAAAPGRRRRQHPLRRRAPARRALQDPARASRHPACSTSPPTTSTPRASPGSSGTCRNTRARSSSSPTTATSSTTSPSGFSSSTGARAFPGKGTTRRGWSRNRPGWRSRRSRRAPAASNWPASSSGCGCRRGRGSPRTGPGCSATSSLPARKPTSATRRSCSRSRPARTWARWSSRPRISPRPTASGSCSRK